MTRSFYRCAILALGLSACSDSSIPLASCPANTQMNAIGQCSRNCTNDASCLLGETCSAGVCTGLEVPTVALFQVAPQQVLVDSMVRVNYVVVGGNEATLTVSSINGDTFEVIPLSSAAFAGSRLIGPLFEDSVVSIEVRRGDLSDERQEIVQVQGEDEVRIDKFEGQPQVISPGDEVTLSWEVANSIWVQISANGELLAEDLEEEDGFTLSLGETTVFELSASDGNEIVQATVTIQVRDEGMPEIKEFDVVRPQPLVEGDSVGVSWETVNADGVRLILQSEDGEIQEWSFNGVLAERGRWLVLPRQGRHQLTLQLISSGEIVVVDESLEVNPPPVSPVNLDVELTPDVLVPGMGLQRFTVRWLVSPETAGVTVTFPDGTGLEFPGSGETEFFADSESPFADVHVEAVTPQGAASRWARAWSIMGEGEPNDSQLEATPIEERGRAGTLRALPGGQWESDWFLLNVPTDGGLSIDLRSNICPEGLMFELSSPETVDPIRFRTGRNQECPSLYAPTAGAGTYWIRVWMDMAAPGMNSISYTLLARALPPSCGDGQRAISEACDDGNRISGDGCSAVCQAEYDVRQSPNFIPSLPDGQRVEFLPLPNSGAEEGVGLVIFPQAFDFFGHRYSGAFVYTNGYISFIPPDSAAFDVRAPFGPTQPNGLVGLFVADLRLRPDEEAGVRISSIDGGDIAFDFQGFSVRGANNSRLSGRIHLTNDGRVGLHYDPEIAGGLLGRRVGTGLEDPEGQQIVSACAVDNTCTVTELSGQSFEFSLGQ